MGDRPYYYEREGESYGGYGQYEGGGYADDYGQKRARHDEH